VNPPSFNHSNGAVRTPVLAIAITVVALVIAAVAWHLHSNATRARFLMADPESIANDAVLTRYAMARGPGAFVTHCASCHGAGLKGDTTRGVPNLADKDWLYGSGRVTEIERTILYGIRSGHPKAWNLAAMPAYATANPYKVYKVEPLSPQDIDDVTAFVLAFRHPASDGAAEQRGASIFRTRGLCFDCHGEDAKGDPAIGAPDLTDNIWLYGDDTAPSIHRSIAHGLEGFCPAWINQLPAETIRSLAVYISSVSRVAAHE
jgi:cytochrome c oxidase cbb3-type subunit 3